MLPTEVAAISWRRELLRCGALSAINERRVLSWDRFKAILTPAPTGHRPISRSLRRLFIYQLLEENRQTPLLSALVPPQFAHQPAIFGVSIERALGALPRLPRKTKLERLPTNMQGDILLLRHRYSQFLLKYSIHDPLWSTQQPLVDQQRYMVLFPDALADLSHYRATLQSSGQVMFRRLTSDAQSQPNLRQCATIHQELSQLIDEIERVLDGGSSPNDVAISLSDSERWAPYLRSYAWRHALPLTFHHQRALTDWAPGRLLVALEDFRRSHYSLASLRALLLDNCIPWRHPKLGRALIEVATQQSLLRGDAAAWKLLLRTYRPNRATHKVERGQLEQFQAALFAHTTALFAARDFAQLQRRLHSWHEQLINVDQWSKTDSQIWRLILNQVMELASIEKHLELSCHQPVELFLALLRDTQYVPATDSSTVAVYPYPQAAGVAIPHHFVLNCSQESTRVTTHWYDFLSEEQQATLELNDYDLSNNLLELLSVSGQLVRLSCSQETPAGRSLPAMYFVTDNTVESAAPTPPDRYQQEENWLAGVDQSPSSIYRVQQQGAGYANATGLAPSGTNYGRALVAHIPTRELIDGKLQDQQGHLRVSANLLQRYNLCPFGCLINDVWQLRDEPRQPQPDDALRMGSFYHKVLQRLYRAIAEEEPLFRRGQLSHYRVLARALLQRLIHSHVLIPPQQNAWRERVLTAVDAVLEFDARRFDTYEIVSVEQRVEYSGDDEDSHQPLLVGKIDRLMRNRDSKMVAIIEYKKSKIPQARHLHDQQRGTPEWAPQSIFYVDLLQSLGHSVEAAYYVSLEDKTARALFDLAPTAEQSQFQRRAPLFGRDDLEIELQALRDAIGATATAINQGNFQFPDLYRGCQQCRMKQLCRTNYFV